MYECASVLLETFKTFPEKKNKKKQQDLYKSLHYVHSSKKRYLTNQKHKPVDKLIFFKRMCIFPRLKLLSRPPPVELL